MAPRPRRRLRAAVVVALGVVCVSLLAYSAGSVPERQPSTSAGPSAGLGGNGTATTMAQALVTGPTSAGDTFAGSTSPGVTSAGANTYLPLGVGEGPSAAVGAAGQRLEWLLEEVDRAEVVVVGRVTGLSAGGPSGASVGEGMPGARGRSQVSIAVDRWLKGSLTAERAVLFLPGPVQPLGLGDQVVFMGVAPGLWPAGDGVPAFVLGPAAGGSAARSLYRAAGAVFFSLPAGQWQHEWRAFRLTDLEQAVLRPPNM